MKILGNKDVAQMTFEETVLEIFGGKYEGQVTPQDCLNALNREGVEEIIYDIQMRIGTSITIGLTPTVQARIRDGLTVGGRATDVVGLEAETRKLWVMFNGLPTEIQSSYAQSLRLWVEGDGEYPKLE